MSDPLTAQEQHKRRQAVRELMPRTPFIGGLGIVFERYEPDDVVIRLPFRTDLTNDGTYFHGGVIASVMDTAGAAAPWSNHDFDRGTRAATVAMSIQYTDAARNSPLPRSPQPIPTGTSSLTLCKPTGSSSASAPNVHSGRKNRRRNLAMVTRSAQSPWRKAVGRPAGNAVFQWDLEAVQDRSDHSPCAYHRNEFDENHFVAM